MARFIKCEEYWIDADKVVAVEDYDKESYFVYTQGDEDFEVNKKEATALMIALGIFTSKVAEEPKSTLQERVVKAGLFDPLQKWGK